MSQRFRCALQIFETIIEMKTGNMTRAVPLVAALVLYALSASNAAAQSTGLFGSSGAISNSSAFAPGSGLGSGMGQSSAFGSGGLGTSGTTGMSGTTGQAGAQTQGVTGQRRTTFVGQGNTGRFVGSAQASPQQGAGRFQQNRGAGGNFGQDGGLQNANGQSNSGTAAQRIIRPQQRVAFTYKQPTAERTATALNTRFKKLSDRVDVQGVTVETAGSTVTLRGTVASEDTRRLAAMMAGLEPGVRTVNNQITVNAN